MAVIDSAELLLQAKNYTGTGDWLDEANSHDAQFGTGTPGTNDPQFLAHTGDNYLYFNGSASNYVQITLAVSTTYDITITYEDDTTDTGTFTTTGGGVGSLGGTDAKFASMKVKLIDVYPDGGGATVALFDAALATEPFATVTDTYAKVWTIVRGAYGMYLVDRPMFGLHTDDYFQIADEAGLRFADGEEWTYLLAVRVHWALAWSRVFRKNQFDTSAGYQMHMGATGLVPQPSAHDTSNDGWDQSAAMTLRELGVVGGRWDETAGELEAFADGTGSGSPYSGAMGSISNTRDLFIGCAEGSSSFSAIQVVAVALWRSALSDADVATAGDELLALTELQTVIRPISDTAGTGWDSAPVGSQDLFAQVDEVVFSDTDYIFTEDPNP